MAAEEETNDEPAIDDPREGSDEQAPVPSGDEAGSPSLAGRLVARGTRQAQRAAGAAGLDRALESAIEEALVRAVESEATERAVARILNGPMVEQAVGEALRSEAVEQAVLEIVDSELVDRVWGRVLESDETQRLIERIAESPEIRSAIASQGMGLIDDLGREVSTVTRLVDFVLERVARKVLFRPARSAPTDRVGLSTRALALAIDAVLVNAGLFTATAVLGLLSSFLGLDIDRATGPIVTLGAFSWLAVSSLYLFTFWAISGQTPGMRFLDIRIERDGRSGLGIRPAFRRLAGFWLAALPFGLGFLGVLIRLDRRGFHDRLGGTDVYYVDPSRADAPHRRAVVYPSPAGPAD